MTSLLFLDIDGVLNGHEKLASGYCGIRQENVFFLNHILDHAPDMQLVISSAWRYMILRGEMSVRGFEMLLLVNGIKCFGRVHGHTVADGEVADEPSHLDDEAWRTAGLLMRGAQIERYVIEHRPASWAVVDDLPLAIDPTHFIQTDSARGLTANVAWALVEILSHKRAVA